MAADDARVTIGLSRFDEQQATQVHREPVNVHLGLTNATFETRADTDLSPADARMLAAALVVRRGAGRARRAKEDTNPLM